MAEYDVLEYCLIPPPYGGATIHVKRLVDKLKDDGMSVGGFYSKITAENKSLAELPSFYEDKYNNTSNKFKRALAHIKRSFKHLSIARRFKVIHYHGLENLEFIWAVRRLLNKKVVITVHSAMIGSFYNATSRINRFFLKKLADSDVQWIAVSPQAKDEMEKLPFSFRKEIKIIPAYIPQENSNSAPLSESMQQYVAGHSKIITFYAHSFMVHNRTDVYGFEAAMKLFSVLLNEYDENLGMVLCISDISEPEKISRLHQRANELGVDNKIYWQEGPIDNMKTLWEHTDVYVRPTSTDGDSVAVREVLESGGMVVASDVCERPTEAAVYRYGDEKDLIVKVKDALDSPRKEKVLNWQPYEEVREVIESML